MFGYQERYAELRYRPSRVTGFFASNAYDSLDSWHWSQFYGTVNDEDLNESTVPSGAVIGAHNVLPTLSKDFIEEDTPLDRTIAVSDTVSPQFVAMISFQDTFIRVLPKYGIPADLGGGNLPF